MLKEITRKDVLDVLRQHEERFSRYPNSQNLITLELQEWDEDAEQPEPFDVDIRFTFPNYIYLIHRLYTVEKGTIKDGGLGIDIFSLVPKIKTIVKRLQDDHYVNITQQKCSFHTDKEVHYNPHDEVFEHIEIEKAEMEMRTGEPYKIYIQAESRFSKDELRALNISINLTTKGQGLFLYFKEKFISEPVGLVSLVISAAAFLVSLLSLLY